MNILTPKLKKEKFTMKVFLQVNNSSNKNNNNNNSNNRFDHTQTSIGTENTVTLMVDM